MPRPVVLVADALGPAAEAALRVDFDVRRVDGSDRAALLAAVPEAEALVVRSGTRVDAAVLAAATRLRVLAHAGSSLDHVDVRAATLAGVMVVTAPEADLVSAAELTIGLVLAAARRIPQAHQALREGRWERERVGTELYGKTLGVLGLGRVGVLVAQRLAAFGMRVVAHDPYAQPGRAAQLGVRMVDLDTLLTTADVMTVHLPRTPETHHLLGVAELERVKPGLVLVNAARGGIVDEVALHAALKEGRVAAAGLDVFADEPCTDTPLLDLDDVVATPHLGASTHEALERAGLAVARSVAQALAGELVPDAVNVHGGRVEEAVRPSIALTERLGRVFSAVAGGIALSLDVEVRGEIAGHDVKVLELAALTGVFGEVVEESVTYVNVPLLAAERGTSVRLVADPESPDHRSLVTLRGTLADGRQVSVGGTVVHGRERLVEVEGYDVDVVLADHLAFLVHPDRPGMVGTVGGILGAAGTNIAGMQVARREPGGDVLVVLSLDSPLGPALLEEIATATEATRASAVTVR